MLQARDSDELPAQAAPPLAGAGLSQKRVLVWEPLPQLWLQVAQADQAPQFPFTKAVTIIN